MSRIQEILDGLLDLAGERVESTECGATYAEEDEKCSDCRHSSDCKRNMERHAKTAELRLAIKEMARREITTWERRPQNVLLGTPGPPG